MRARFLALAGVSAAALVAATAVAPMANAASSGAGKAIPTSLAAGYHGKVAAKPTKIDKKGKCGSGFGNELSTPDGIIAWNDGSGSTFDTAGAADIKCKKKTKINSVSVYGYLGAATETFHVTFYANDPADGSNEPNDAAVKCDYPSLTGAAGGQYPTHVLTQLSLTKPCKLKKGTWWVSVQNVDSSTPWYWEMQDTQAGTAGPDWVDRHDAFGSGCTTFDNDRYLVDCLGYPYQDWMLLLG